MGRVEVSSPDKLIFPADGITKAQMVAHYDRAGERLLEFATGRPLTLQRFPGGIEANGFMQKNAANYFPSSIRRLPVPKREGGETQYPVIERVEDLVYLANQNTVTFHMWTSSADRPAHPDWMIIDLDPEAGDLERVRLATTAVRAKLRSFGVDGFAVATGAKGFHVWVPLVGRQGFDEIAQAARALAGLAVLSHPDDLTVEFLKKNRKGRVYVDWLRNNPTATVVTPFSLRPRPGAPVAVPIDWNELDGARPDGWRIGAIDDRLGFRTEIDGQRLPVADIIDAARDAGVDLDTPHDRFGRSR